MKDIRMGRIEIDSQRCKGCELCVAQCPQKAITIGTSLNQQGYYFAVALHPDRCTGCALCAEVCPDLAIAVFKGEGDGDGDRDRRGGMKKQGDQNNRRVHDGEGELFS